MVKSSAITCTAVKHAQHRQAMAVRSGQPLFSTANTPVHDDSGQFPFETPATCRKPKTEFSELLIKWLLAVFSEAAENKDFTLCASMPASSDILCSSKIVSTSEEFKQDFHNLVFMLCTMV